MKRLVTIIRCGPALCIAGALLGAGPAAAQPARGAAATYTNPVWDADFPDPTVIRARDGYYYAYGTQGSPTGQPLNLQVARSADLVHWTHLGDALPTKPAWAHTTYSFWAPHVSEVGGTYYLYFSAKPDAETRAGDGLCLGVATATSPAGPFTATAEPLQCGPGFVNIDPMAFDDPATGKHWLYWGSGFGPLKVQELAPDRLHFAPGSAPQALVAPDPTDRPDNYRRLVEGSWVTLHDGWYYLFFSGDNCCGDRAHYAVLVARSRAATGPFEVQPVPVVARNAQWRAPGHNSVVTDAAGHDWLAYHALHAGPTPPGTPANTGRVLLLDRLAYAGGWPRVVPDGTPSTGPRPAPAVPQP
ncbi:MAG: glycoside hydrolase family 43 protein [Janthinobacterium lividum]